LTNKTDRKHVTFASAPRRTATATATADGRRRGARERRSSAARSPATHVRHLAKRRARVGASAAATAPRLLLLQRGNRFGLVVGRRRERRPGPGQREGTWGCRQPGADGTGQGRVRPLHVAASGESESGTGPHGSALSTSQGASPIFSARGKGGSRWTEIPPARARARGWWSSGVGRAGPTGGKLLACSSACVPPGARRHVGRCVAA
jgi:hypothetical protein